MQDISFILSTGRTGTQFFEDYINGTSKKAFCLHEPKPSRRFKFLSNMYLSNKVSDKLVHKVFKLSRKKILKRCDNKNYIESNNFLFGSIQALKQNDNRRIKVLHITRNPITYINSHLNHGFWEGFKKFTAKNVPFWLEKLTLSKHERKDPIFVLAARWALVNKTIENNKTNCEYLFIKFEDLFSKDKEVAVQTLIRIREFFDLEYIDPAVNLNWLSKPKNFSKQKQTKYQINDKHVDFLTREYGELLKKYDYYPLG